LSRGFDLEEKSENNLLQFEGFGVEESSLIDVDLNIGITLSSGSSMI